MSTPLIPKAASLPEYIDLVLQIAGSEARLLRGQRCETWPLLPKLGRLQPRNVLTSTTAERELIERFRAQSLPHLQREFKDEWDVLAMAQHHGLATRILDWTSNPLVALWFAVRDQPLDGISGVVHVFAPQNEDYADRGGSRPYSVRKTKFFRHSHLTQRIVVQQGWFSVHRFSRTEDRFSTLGRVVAYKKRIEKVLISGSCFANRGIDLARVGINDATMFPDLDGLSRYLNWDVQRAPSEDDRHIGRQVVRA